MPDSRQRQQQPNRHTHSRHSHTIDNELYSGFHHSIHGYIHAPPPIATAARCRQRSSQALTRLTQTSQRRSPPLVYATMYDASVAMPHMLL